MTLITAVFLAKQKGITSEKFRKALRKDKAAGAPDLQWHHRNDKWEADDNTEEGRKRIESMKLVLRKISN